MQMLVVNPTCVVMSEDDSMRAVLHQQVMVLNIPMAWATSSISNSIIEISGISIWKDLYQ